MRNFVLLLSMFSVPIFVTESSAGNKEDVISDIVQHWKDFALKNPAADVGHSDGSWVATSEGGFWQFLSAEEFKAMTIDSANIFDFKPQHINVRFVGGKNELGVISKTTKELQISNIESKISKFQSDLESSINPAEKKIISKRIDKLINKKKILMTYFVTTSETKLLAAEDDVVTKELHLPVGRKILFRFRSQDVLHSAYLPHFRVQMNCVPGTTTQFAFTPTITTVDMKKEVDDESFEYIMLCNKICGAAHYNMQMKVIVESEEEYNKWLDSQSKISNL